MLSTDASSTGPDAAPTRSLTPMLAISTAVASLGGLLFGFDTAVISGTTTDLRRVFGLDDVWLGVTVSGAMVGTILGSLLASRPADAYGRRPVLAVLGLLYLVSSIGCGLAWNWASLFGFRLLGGLAVGGASVVSPMYVTEISPARLRGRLVAVFQFNLVVGMLLAFLSNYVIAGMDFGSDAWRWMLGVQAAPSLLFLFTSLMIPESPRWLAAHGRDDQARRALATLGADEAIDDEIRDIHASLAETPAGEQDSLFQPAYRKPVMLAFAVALFNQLSGINAVLYYAPDIFKMAGAGKDAALLQAVAVGLINMIFTMAAMTIIDLAGRRTLLIAGSIGYILSLSTAAWAFHYYGGNFTPTGNRIVLGSILVFIASHAFGQGAIIWVFIGEVFPNRARARGQAFGSLVHWIGALVISTTFPLIAAHAGWLAFAFYAACMVVQLLWALFIMPETKGVPLEEMQKKLGITTSAA